MNSDLLWDDASVFLAIARSGTLSGAATVLGMGIATVSRRLTRLESALGVRLFSRHQSGYRLTIDGESLVQYAERLESAGHAFGKAAHEEQRVAGRVRLATAENLASELIVPSFPKLLSSHPELRLELVTGVETINLHRREADLAVRMVKPEVGNVTIRRIGTLEFGLYASRSYVDARGTQVDAAEYGDDSFVGWSDYRSQLPGAKWLDRTLQGKPYRVSPSSLSVQLAAVAAGLGLAVLPHFLARRMRLVCLSAELGVRQLIWLVIHSDLVQSKRVRAVADHLIELFDDQALQLNRTETSSGGHEARP